MIRRLVLVLVICCIVSPATFGRRRAANPTQGPRSLPGLTPAQVALFEAGRDEFDKLQTVDDGLGPIMNNHSCSLCHNTGGVGGSSENTVMRFGTMTNGVFDPLVRLGGPVLQRDWLGLEEGSPFEFRPEFVPPEATIVVDRVSPPLFGLGLVDATPDTTFVALAAEQAARNDGTAGRAAIVDNLAAGMKTVGKFGWKAQLPTLFQFAGDAYLNELGITSPFFPRENCRNGFCETLTHNPRPDLNDDGTGTMALTDFMTLLGPPPRGKITEDVLAGEAVFQRIGCESCHVSTLQTGPNEIAALDKVTYHPYSDFLLHDMGPLGDGIHDGAANGREMRTAPLWGLRFEGRFGGRALLHHGRAPSIEKAIEMHDGQGRAARERFQALDETARAQLLAFLKSL
ncbi:MAG TPA: di-heme oxidoredictase family protein [Thermoanaerobaculia bacterium]|nr:di-heme oxidoredictase family protein [Thermoanaerobaculia bacterium]